ncbi:hypothetical protein WA026_012616 [Henosepilachna vigintioctopunctata]|uniref:Uncharacterized protein n=1 Tax=Henosepilachna vigintioctopunctata TaxID=420089 RepID=A0AAW1U7T0_9CUCU
MKDKSQAFGNLVTSKHREYSKRTKTYVEHYINNILFDADLGQFDYEPSFASTPMSSYSDSSCVSYSADQSLPPKQMDNSSENIQLHIPDDTATEETRETLLQYIASFK